MFCLKYTYVLWRVHNICFRKKHTYDSGNAATFLKTHACTGRNTQLFFPKMPNRMHWKNKILECSCLLAVESKLIEQMLGGFVGCAGEYGNAPTNWKLQDVAQLPKNVVAQLVAEKALAFRPPDRQSIAQWLPSEQTLEQIVPRLLR